MLYHYKKIIKEVNKLNKNKKLFKNSIIFSLGTFGSKLISFVMIPLYTLLFSTNEYGTIDLINNIVALAFPIISLNLTAAVFRFSTDQKFKKKKRVFSTAILILIIFFVVFLCFYPIINKIDFFSNNLIYIYILLFATIIKALFKEFIRAIGKLKVYVISDIIQTFSFLGLNIYLIYYLSLGIKGFLLARAISLFIDSVFLFLGGDLKKYLSFEFDKKIAINMFYFSLPLMPNTIMWWINNVSDRYFIKYYLGVGAVGIYGIAYKFPTLIATLNGIFFKAWEISAIEEFDSKDKEKFYSNIFNKLAIFMFVSSSLLIAIIRPLIEIIISGEFVQSWRYAPFLLLSAVFSSLSGFLGSIYTASKKTIGALISTSIAASINIVLNITLIQMIGIYGAAIATVLSLIILFYIRSNGTKKIININYQKKRLIILFFINSIQILCLLIINSLLISLFVQIILVIFICFINRDEFKKLKDILWKKVRDQYNDRY